MKYPFCAHSRNWSADSNFQKQVLINDKKYGNISIYLIIITVPFCLIQLEYFCYFLLNLLKAVAVDTKKQVLAIAIIPFSTEASPEKAMQCRIKPKE